MKMCELCGAVLRKGAQWCQVYDTGTAEYTESFVVCSTCAQEEGIVIREDHIGADPLDRTLFRQGRL